MRRATNVEIAAYIRIRDVYLGKIEHFREERGIGFIEARDIVLKAANAATVDEYFERRKVYIKGKVSVTDRIEYYWYEDEYNAVNEDHRS